jgi:hypothetical protein
MGYFLHEAAIAESIHTDSAIRQNEYLFGCEVSAVQRLRARRKQARELRNVTYARVLHAPNRHDIENGDALNALVRGLMDPCIDRSNPRMEPVCVPSGVIERVPWFMARIGLVVAPGRPRADGRWPVALQGPAFKRGRCAYDRAVEEVLRGTGRGVPSPAVSAAVDRSIGELRAILRAVVGNAPSADQADALVFLDGLSKAARMLRVPAAAEVLASLSDHPGTSMVDLLDVMSRHHLQFGPAESAAERAIYRDLYPLLSRQADLRAAQGDVPGPELATAPTAVDRVAEAGPR